MSRYHHVRAAAAEQHRDPRGETTSFLATAAETDGRVAVFDSVLESGKGAPWHYHEIDDEIFYVITGRMEFGVADETLVAYPGDLVIVGPNVARRFEAVEDSRLIVINAPAGPAEGFLRDIMRSRRAPDAGRQGAVCRALQDPPRPPGRVTAGSTHSVRTAPPTVKEPGVLVREV